MTDVWDKLKAEFPQSAISWRAQSVTKTGDKALALAYITSRDVMERLDSVVGPANWQTRYEFNAGTAVCYLSLRIDGEWVTKADGAGSTDVEAEKGQLSDAFKRSAVHWSIGRYLYDMPSPWVPCESYERNGKYTWSKWKDDPWNHVRGKPSQAPPEPSKPSTPSPKTSESKQEAKRLGKDIARNFYADMQKTIRAAKNLDDLKNIWIGLQTQIKELPVDWEKSITECKDEKKADLQKEAGPQQIKVPDFSKLDSEPTPDALDEILDEVRVAQQRGAEAARQDNEEYKHG